MKTASKLLSLLLALAMVFTMLPMPAQAEEASISTEPTRVSVPFQINPLYEGLITEADLDIPEIPEADPNQVRPQATTYLTIDAAGDQVRQYMKNREGVFTVYVKSDDSNHKAVSLLLFDDATAHTGKGTEGDYLMWQYGGWSLEGSRSYNPSTKLYEYDLTFSVPYYTTAAQETEMNTAVTNLINSLGVKGKSDYDKIYAVYDWLCKNVTYDYANLNDTTYLLKHTAYAALIDRTAVCQGYAVLFYRLMLELGVDSRVIVGDGGGPHAWNIVELNNLYYNLDSTWDAGQSEYIWFLNSYWDFGGHEREMEYDTIAFHNEYPLAAESYVAGKTATKDPYICAGYCGANTDNAEWWLGRDGTLTIKGQGDMFDVPSDKDPYYTYWESEITKVVVESGITRVGADNFYGFTGLKEVQLPATVTNIGTDAFRSCTNLTTVKSAGGLVTIEDRAFSYCPALKTVSLPNTLKTIGSRAFTECRVLTGVTLPSSLETIGEEAFSYCSGLTSITIPGTVASIGQNAFYYCGSLTSATLSEGLTQVPYGMFNQCQKLTTLKLPSTLKSIGHYAFSGCFALSSITLPSGLESIGVSAFTGCNFSKVQIPESVTAIGSYAFSGCTKLATVNLPKGLTVIADGTFRECPLTSVTIPAGVTRIGSDAFNQTKLSQVVVPEGVTEIGNDAFGYVTTLKKITLPSTLKSLSGFRGCTGLTAIDIPEGVTELGDYAFYECTALKSIDIPAGVTTIGFGAFARCSALTELVLPESLTELPNYMAENCTGLTSIVIPASVTAVGNASVGGCTNLKEITFEGNAPTFQWNSFSGVTATAYYPTNRTGWTSDVMQNYDGTITWVGYTGECSEHSYEAVVTAPTCQAQGYTTYTCSLCGDSYVGDYTDPVDHSYENDECIWCGDEIYSAAWKGFTTSMNGTIDLNAYVKLSDTLLDESDVFVRFSYAGNTVNVPLNQARPTTQSGEDMHIFRVSMFAKQMSEVVTMQVMKGETPIGEERTYSVMQYCLNRIEKSSNAKMVALAKAMLNYGAAAQIYFNYNTDNLANAGLSDADKVLPEVPDLSDYKAYRTGSQTGIKVLGSSPMLESEVSIRTYFAVEEGYSIDDFVLSLDGVMVPVYQNSTGYYIETAGIAAKNMDQMFQFSAGGLTYHYGVLTYISNKLTSTNPNTVNLVKAMYGYHITAKDYLG